jgi:hypothetical protein
MDAHIKHWADNEVFVFASEALVPTSSWLGGIGHQMISLSISLSSSKNRRTVHVLQCDARLAPLPFHWVIGLKFQFALKMY